MKNPIFDNLLPLSTPRAATLRGVCAVVLVALLTACGGRPGAGSATVDSNTSSEATAARKTARYFDFPHPPAALADRQEQLAYVVEHYWDRFDFADTTWIADTAVMEQAYANYLSLLPMLPDEHSTAAQRTLIDKAAHNAAMFNRFVEMAEHYLHDPNSPMRSEELFIPVLEAVIAQPALDELYKIRPRAQLAMALKNRPGMVAADFAYTTASGASGRLSGLRAEHTVLLFYNPGCADCARVEEFIAKSAVFAPLIASGAVKLLALYTEDDLDTWRKHIPYLPASWTIAYDRGLKISKQELYDLRAIPCLYLLDARKRVVLKDAPVEQIEAWLAQNDK